MSISPVLVSVTRRLEKLQREILRGLGNKVPFSKFGRQCVPYLGKLGVLTALLKMVTGKKKKML